MSDEKSRSSTKVGVEDLTQSRQLGADTRTERLADGRRVGLHVLLLVNHIRIRDCLPRFRS